MAGRFFTNPFAEDEEVNPFSNHGSVAPAKNSRLSPLPPESAGFNYGIGETVDIPIDGSGIAETERFKCLKKDGTVKLQGSKEGRKGHLGIDAEIFEVTPSFSVVEVKKTAGDKFEYMQFHDKGLRPSLTDIVWTWQGNEPQQQHPPSTDKPVP